MNKFEIEKLTKKIINACYNVHKEMGPGLLESVYELCLVKELDFQNIHFQCQYPIPLIYKGIELAKDYRIDILVEDEIILEIKAIETLSPIHEAQIISYLKLAGKKLGFLVNFNVPIIKKGIRRFVNNY